MSVVGSDFEKLKRFNLAEMYDPTEKAKEMEMEMEKGKEKEMEEEKELGHDVVGA